MQLKGNDYLLQQAKRTLRSLIRMERSRSQGISQVNLNTLEKSLTDFIEKIFNKLAQKIIQSDVYLADLERLNELSKYGADDVSRSLINEERSLLKRYFNLPNHYKISLIEKYYNNYLRQSQLSVSSNHNDMLNQRENLQNCRSSLEGAHGSLISLITSKATQCEKKYLNNLSQRLNLLINKQFNEMVNKVRTCNRLQMPAEQFLNRYKKKKAGSNIDNPNRSSNPYELATLQNRHQELFYEEDNNQAKSPNQNKKTLLGNTSENNKSIKNTRYDKLAEDIMQGKNLPNNDNLSGASNDSTHESQAQTPLDENKSSYEEKKYESGNKDVPSGNADNQASNVENIQKNFDHSTEANTDKSTNTESCVSNDNNENKLETASSSSEKTEESANQSSDDLTNNSQENNTDDNSELGSNKNSAHSNEPNSEQNNAVNSKTTSSEENASQTSENNSAAGNESSDSNQLASNTSSSDSTESLTNSSQDSNQLITNNENSNQASDGDADSSNASEKIDDNKERKDKNLDNDISSNNESNNDADVKVGENETKVPKNINELNNDKEGSDNYLPAFANHSEEGDDTSGDQTPSIERKDEVPEGAEGTGQMFAMADDGDNGDQNNDDTSVINSDFTSNLSNNDSTNLSDLSNLNSSESGFPELRLSDQIDKSTFSSYDSENLIGSNIMANDSTGSNQDSQLMSSIARDFQSLSSEDTLGIEDINFADSYLEELVDDLISNKSGLWSEPGSEEGKLASREINNFTKFFELIDECSGIQKLLKIMGKSMGLDKQQKRRIREHLSAQDKILSENSREEFTGITMGNEISYVLPEEIVKISDPLTESLFDINYFEGNLLSFDLSGFINVSSGGNERIMTSPRHGRGPVVLCVDTSSSMRGIPENYAKAVAMSLALKCRSAKRDCYIINFSVSIEKMLLKSDSPNAISRLNGFLGKSFDGGSDLDEALIECLALMRNDPRFFHSDVLCITDGQIKFSKQLEKMVKSRRNHERNHFYELVIGSLANEQYWIEAKQSLYDQSRIFDHLYELGQDGKWIREITL